MAKRGPVESRVHVHKMAASEEMADSKHLAQTIKKTHAVLRSNVRNAEENFEKVWKDHKSNLENLQTYADAMAKLSRSWTETHPSIGNRIEWCRFVCKDYFHDGGMEKALEKEQKKIYHQKLRDKEIVEKFSFEKFYQTRQCDSKQDKWKANSKSSKTLLDVGSCFNPFQNFQDEFDVVAIDLCPASSSGVFQADFLEISVTSQEREGTEQKGATSHEAETLHDVQMDSENTINTEIYPLEVMARLSSEKGDLEEDLAGISKDSASSCADRCRDAECMHDSKIDDVNKDIYSKQGHKLEERQEYRNIKHENPAPAIERLKLSLTQSVSELPAGFFDVVMFSLFLSYLPIPKLRWDCCRKANRLLSRQGLLLIIESDSAHQNRNSKQMKSWKVALESIGFVRYKYEKLAHLHCMAFRKIKDVTEPPNHADMMFIPQDFHGETEAEEAVSEPLLRDESTNEEISELFEELPNF